MAGYNKVDLIPTGANTNQTSASKTPTPDAEIIAFRIVCEVIGATPAITWQIFGSLDDASVPDANSLWDAIGYVTEATDTIAFTTRTGPIVAGTAQANWLSSVVRCHKKYRAVITGILNVTYRVEMHTLDQD
jgi:hypothetical protein